MMKNKSSLFLTSFVCIIPLFVGLILLSRLPAQIPVQWGSNGEVSTYAPKWFAIAGLPVFFLFMNLFLYTKAEKSDLSSQYPESMKLFLKWSMPMLAVVCTAVSYASALGNSMIMAGTASFIGAAIVILGSYFHRLNNAPAVRLIFSVSDEKAAEIFSLCGNIFMVVGIIAIFLAGIGQIILSFEFSAAAFIITIVYSRISGKK